MASRMDSTEPIWTQETPAIAALSANARADVCVVGAGIAGLSTAYLLGLLGRSVIVLEQEGIGSGETGRTTAHLTSVLDRRFHELRGLHGDASARLAAASHAAAIRHVEAVVQAESLDCGFLRVDGYLVPGGVFERRRAGGGARRLPGARPPCRAPPRRSPPFGRGPALRFPDQAWFHPLRYLAGLSRAIRSRGGSIVRARAEEIGGTRTKPS